MKKSQNNNRYILKDKTIKQTIVAIQKNSIRAIAVIDKNRKFFGIITDGDIRRIILREIDLNEKISKFLNKKSISYKLKDDYINYDNLRNIVKKNELLHLPIVDNKNKFIDLYTYEELFKRDEYSNDIVIMSGGQGKRLKPLTNRVPKPLININGKPMIDLIIQELNYQGFKNFFITINYLSSKIKNYINTQYKESLNKFVFIKEEKKLGTAGSLYYLKKLKISNEFIIYNCDIISKIDLKKMIEFHKINKFQMTIATINYEQKIDYGIINKNNKNYFLQITEKPTVNFEINGGIYVINSNLLKYITKPEYLDMNQFMSLLTNKKIKIGVYNTQEFWIDVGTHHSLNLAIKSLNN